MSAPARERLASLWTLYGAPLLLIAAAIVTTMALLQSGATDYRTFIQSGRQWLGGGGPDFSFVPARGPNLNPPWVTVLMSPFSRLSYATGLLAWSFLGLFCLVAASAVIAKAVFPGQAGTILCAILVTQTSFVNLGLGQVASPLMLLVTLAWLADRAGRALV